MSNIDKRAFAMTKELATLMVERFSMNPVSCKLLNEAWKKEFPDEVAIADRMLALLDELEAAESRIAELEAREVNLPKLSVGEVMHMSGFSRDYAEGWCSGNDNAIHEIHAAGVKVAAAAGKGE